MSILIASLASLIFSVIALLLFKWIKPKNNDGWFMPVIYVLFGLVIGLILSQFNDVINIGPLAYLAMAITPCAVLLIDEIRERKSDQENDGN